MNLNNQVFQLHHTMREGKMSTISSLCLLLIILILAWVSHRLLDHVEFRMVETRRLMQQDASQIIEMLRSSLKKAEKRAATAQKVSSAFFEYVATICVVEITINQNKPQKVLTTDGGKTWLTCHTGRRGNIIAAALPSDSEVEAIAHKARQARACLLREKTGGTVALSRPYDVGKQQFVDE